MGTALFISEKMAWLQQNQVNGQTDLDELYKSFRDAIAKPEAGKTSILLGDHLISMEVKKGHGKNALKISDDATEFQLNEKQIENLFGK
jgi:hypothetical protein